MLPFLNFLSGADRWMTFDPRNNVARIGRIVVARGRTQPTSRLLFPSARMC
jgi:transglutaminase-like putative cysteine protease